METVEVVIRLKKERYDELQKNKHLPNRLGIEKAITDGTVLPKGHGRLIDADVATKSINAFHDSFVRECDMLSGKFSIVCTAPTVIEADREVEDEGSGV